MRKTSTKQRKTKQPKQTAKLERKIKDLVLIDQAPIRKSFFKDCQKVIKKIDKLKLQIQHFERSDKPAYENWLNNEFGEEILHLKKITQELEEKKVLLEEIEEEAYYNDINLHQAFIRVQHRHEHPEDYEEEDIFDEEPEFGDYEDDYEFDEDEEDDLEKDFKQFIHDFFDAENAKFAQDFFEEMGDLLGIKRKEKETADARLKDRYRYIVQKLHPDNNKEQAEYEKELWFEVQEAYQQKDLERLDMLIALYNIRNDETEKESSLFELKYTLNVLNKSQSYLKTMLTKIKKEPCWNFLTFTKQKLDKVYIKVQTEIEDYTAITESELHQINSLLEDIQKEPKPRKRKKKREVSIEGQLEFGF